MEITALLLSRIQFAATVSFHIIFPSFTIGLAAWLAVLEAMTLATGNRIYREVFEFWLKIFRAMVGCGVIMLALAWIGSVVARRGRLEQRRWLLWPLACSFPLGFIAILAGWFTAEVGRQPWTVYGLLRTADAMTPFLTARAATISLLVFGAMYSFIFAFGAFYIYRLLRAGPAGRLVLPSHSAIPNRPLSVVDEPLAADPIQPSIGE